jgi:hypothetical protein
MLIVLGAKSEGTLPPKNGCLGSWEFEENETARIRRIKIFVFILNGFYEIKYL